MNIKEVNKLKLLEDEVVYCDSFELACRCCELAYKLGLTWRGGKSYTETLKLVEPHNQITYDFYEGFYAIHSALDKKLITATEWLNRHGIFVFGQEVLCTDHDDTTKEDYYRRIYVAPYVAVHKKDSERLGQKISFATTAWSYMYSPFHEWKDEEPNTTITLADGTKVELSQESYEELKKAVK